MSDPGLTGAVLAGGGSRRFGTDKAAAEIGGVPLVLRAYRALSAVAPTVRVVGAAGPGVPDGSPRVDLPRLPDLRPGEGPLSGVEAALDHARRQGARGVVVLACDLPLVDPPALALLVHRWAASAVPSATLALPGQPAQPLAAVWGVELLPAVRKALDDGRRRVVDLVDEVAHLKVSAAELGARVGLAGDALLWNVNRPSDLPALPAMPLPPVVSVVGWKDSGKTTVAVKLLQALRERGIVAAAAKHGHGFRLDHPGTDSWRLRHETGASPVLLAGPEGEVLQRPAPEGEAEAPLAALIRRHLPGATLVVAEGWKGEGWLSVEVEGGAEEGTIVPPEGAASGRCLARVAGTGAGDGVERSAPDLGARLVERLLDRVPGLA